MDVVYYKGNDSYGGREIWRRVTVPYIRLAGKKRAGFERESGCSSIRGSGGSR